MILEKGNWLLNLIARQSNTDALGWKSGHDRTYCVFQTLWVYLEMLHTVVVKSLYKLVKNRTVINQKTKTIWFTQPPISIVPVKLCEDQFWGCSENNTATFNQCKSISSINEQLPVYAPPISDLNHGHSEYGSLSK